jgi:hypothetical protein
MNSIFPRFSPLAIAAPLLVSVLRSRSSARADFADPRVVKIDHPSLFGQAVATTDLRRECAHLTKLLKSAGIINASKNLAAGKPRFIIEGFCIRPTVRTFVAIHLLAGNDAPFKQERLSTI